MNEKMKKKIKKQNKTKTINWNFFFYKKDVVVKVYIYIYIYAITLHQVFVTKVKVIAGLMHSSYLDHISLFKSVKGH